MTDFIEIDFLEAGDKGSGDAIAIRHHRNEIDSIYVVDGGYTDDGQKLVDHIRKYYGDPGDIDHVVLTHPGRGSRIWAGNSAQRVQRRPPVDESTVGTCRRTHAEIRALPGSGPAHRSPQTRFSESR